MKYVNAELNIIEFEIEDIILTSATGDELPPDEDDGIPGVNTGEK